MAFKLRTLRSRTGVADNVECGVGNGRGTDSEISTPVTKSGLYLIYLNKARRSGIFWEVVYYYAFSWKDIFKNLPYTDNSRRGEGRKQR
jgi:hypothetical protein